VCRSGGFHDAFRGRRGLSTNYARALAVIETEVVRSASDLAEKASLPHKTAERALAVLKKEALTEKKEGCWQRTETTLDEIAKRRGTFGFSKAQKIEHARERNNYRDLIGDPRRVRKLKTLERGGSEPPDTPWEPEFRQAACWRPRRRGGVGNDDDHAVRTL
jgi:hypothetical protein